MTEFEVRATQKLTSLTRAAWIIAGLITIGIVLSLFSSSDYYYEGEELDAHYAVTTR